jgi:hypothetical protein
VDWEHKLIRWGNDVKTAGSSEPLPLSDLAYRVLRKWKNESNPQREDRLERYVETSRRAAFSDLQPAACILYAAKLGSS